MIAFILENEFVFRFCVFLFILSLMMVVEVFFPRKKRQMKRARRWVSNLLLSVISGLFIKFVFPIVAVGGAVFALQKKWGLFNLIDCPTWMEIILSIIILDVLIYWQHVASHRIDFLWRFHKVHHVDRDIDVTTGVRFHPVEIILSMCFKILIVMIIGAPVLAVILFEIILNGCALFNHSNIRLPAKVDRILRHVIVTPDMHRVHHSSIITEASSNYGFSVSLWDYIFRSYTAQPSKGHDNMVIGLKGHQSKAPNSLSWSLWLPLKAKKKLEKWF